MADRLFQLLLGGQEPACCEMAGPTCFRALCPMFAFKLQAGRCGPSQSRCLIIFAPPGARPASPFVKPTRATGFCHLSALQLPQEEDDSLSSPEATSNTEEGLQAVEAWIQARRQLRSELESLGDVEKWLAHKPALSYQEAARWESIRARRAERKAAVKPAMTQSPDVSAEVHGKWRLLWEQ